MCTRLGKDGLPFVKPISIPGEQEQEPALEVVDSQTPPELEERLATTWDRVQNRAASLEVSKLKLDADSAEMNTHTQEALDQNAWGKLKFSQDHEGDRSNLLQRVFDDDEDDEESGDGQGLETGSGGAVAGELGLTVGKVTQATSGSETFDEVDSLRVEEIVEAIKKAQSGLDHLPIAERRAALLDVLRGRFPNIDLMLGDNGDYDADDDFMSQDGDDQESNRIFEQYRLSRDGSSDTARLSRKERKNKATDDLDEL